MIEQLETKKDRNIGPLLDDGLKWGTPKALKGLPLSLLFCLSVCVSVCLSVCLLPSYRPQFSTQQPNFLKICSLGLWEKSFFPFFEIFIFGHLRPISVKDISTPDVARDRDQRGTTGTGASVDRDWVPLISCLVCQTVSGLREGITGHGRGTVGGSDDDLCVASWLGRQGKVVYIWFGDTWKKIDFK